MSIYREEAIDTLISCLRNTEFPAAQIAAAETIVSLQGRFSASGKPLTRAFLKRAGLDKSFQTLMRMEQLSNIPGEFDETAVSFFIVVITFHFFLSLCLLYFLLLLLLMIL
jgi:hypothetical protein